MLTIILLLVTALASNVRADMRDNTVHIISHDYNNQASGSGVVVAPNLILTEAHVTSFDTIEVHYRGTNKFTPAVLVSSNPTSDLALVQTNMAHFAYPILRWGSSFKLGEQVIVLGNPGMGNFRMAITHIVGITKFRFGKNRFLREFIVVDHAGEVGPGYSGGGLYSLDGRLLGIIEMCSPLSCLAIKSSELQQYLKDNLKYNLKEVVK